MATPSNVPFASGGNTTAPDLLFLCEECYGNIGLAVFGPRIIRFIRRPETLCFSCGNSQQTGIRVHKSYSEEIERARRLFLQLEEQRREVEKRMLEYSSRESQ
ncbi:hypothetical protein BJX96DRAFT_176224 [Aspergillus floccosus]